MKSYVANDLSKQQSMALLLLVSDAPVALGGLWCFPSSGSSTSFKGKKPKAKKQHS